MPAINIMRATGDYSNQDLTATDGTYTFYIDAYYAAKSTGAGVDQIGDYLAMTKLERLIGLVRVILENEQYQTLGFARPFVMNRRVVSDMIEQLNSDDATNTAHGRVVFSVRAGCKSPLSIPSQMLDLTTNVTIETGPEGYQYISTYTNP
jgi:hypothetical protein